MPSGIPTTTRAVLDLPMLRKAEAHLRAADPVLTARIGGLGKLLNNLVGYGMVQRVGVGPALKIKVLGLRAAS